MESFEKAYRRRTDLPFGEDLNMVTTCLDILKVQGVLANHNGSWRRLKISGYECHRGIDENQVFAMIDSGYTLLGTFVVRPDFGDLQNGIYELNPPRKPDGPKLDTHIVMFVGHGRIMGRPYLVFLNSYGKDWGTGGLGAVFFDQVLQLRYNKGFQLIRIMVDGHTPAPRLQT